MSNNWAQQFRERIEGGKGRYRATEDSDEVDNEEEEVELEEPEDESEEETQDKLEHETDENEQESKKAEIDKVTPRREETVADYKYRQLIESAKSPPAQSRGNTEAAISACLIAMIGFMVMPLLFKTFSQVLQLFVPNTYPSLGNPYSNYGGWYP